MFKKINGYPNDRVMKHSTIYTRWIALTLDDKLKYLNIHDDLNHIWLRKSASKN